MGNGHGTLDGMRRDSRRRVQVMSVYDEVGGADTVKVVVSVFYNRVLADDRCARWFDGVDLDRLMAHQRAFLTAALDGPDLFTGRSLSAAHQPLDITDEAFDAVTENLAGALLDVGVDRDVVASVVSRVAPFRGAVVTQRAGASS